MPTTRASNKAATMSDAEEDSQMLSSPTESDPEPITTPVNQTANPASSVLSPPGSQRRERAPPTTASGSSIANSNGKRPLRTISHGTDDMEELHAMGTTTEGSKPEIDAPDKTHESSGYTYDKVEDEPGYAWLNKKAQDEYARAWESLQHKESMIKNRFGDPFDAVAKEKAIMASLKQQ